MAQATNENVIFLHSADRKVAKARYENVTDSRKS
jgi:hypothetical protein